MRLRNLQLKTTPSDFTAGDFTADTLKREVQMAPIQSDCLKVQAGFSSGNHTAGGNRQTSTACLRQQKVQIPLSEKQLKDL